MSRITVWHTAAAAATGGKEGEQRVSLASGSLLRYVGFQARATQKTGPKILILYKKGNSSKRESRLLAYEGIRHKQAWLFDVKRSSRTCSRDDDDEPPAGGQLLDNSQVLAKGLGVGDKIR